MTESSLHGPDKNMLAAANNVLHSIQTSIEMVFCQLHYYIMSVIVFLLRLSLHMKLTY
jgi:hypothetical protein